MKTKRIILSVVALLLIGVGTGYAVHWNMIRAGQQKPRLRLCTVAKFELPAGTLLSPEMVETRIKYLPIATAPLSNPSFVIGKYLTRRLADREYIDAKCLISSPPLQSDPTITVPVVVKAEYAETLKSGMRLVFVKTNAILLNSAITDTNSDLGGFLIKEVVLFTNRPNTAILLMELDRAQISKTMALAANDWIPVTVTK